MPPPVGEPDASTGRRVTLVAVDAGRTGATLAGELGGLRAGRGWPHDDTAHAFAFTEIGGRTWLVVDDSGAVVGEAGTKGPPSTRGAVEIGYGLAAPSRGHGIGTAAVRALVELLSREPAISVLEADVALDNLASQRLLERIGFSCVASDDREVHYSLDLRSPAQSPSTDVG